MATITGYGSKHSHEFRLTVNETSTSIVNNTSEVSFSFTIYKASYSWSNWNSITYSITINGTSYTGTIPSYSAGSTMTIRSGSQTIPHNNDGTKSINYSFSVNDGSGQSYTCGNASASGDLILTTIPRASSINSFYGNDIEEYFSVNYTSYYNGFTNKLRLSIPNVIALETFNYSSGQTFKLSTDTINYLYNYMKKMKTVKIGAVIETWNGSTKIGESVELINTCSITNCEPTIESASYLDSNTETTKITANNQQIIRNHSTVVINLTNLKSFKGATLDKCTATINGITKSFSNITGTLINNISLNFGTLDVSANSKITITLTDSRGYSATKELNITIINYIDLSINAVIKRTQPTTGEVDITFSGNYYNGKFGNVDNSLIINWFYRERGTDTWISGGDITPTISNNTFNNGNTTISLGKIFDYQKSYEFYLKVVDKLITLKPTYVVTQGMPVFNWGKDFMNINQKLTLVKGLYSMETGNAGIPVGNGSLIVKKVHNQEAPNNGVVLEYGNSTSWTGQLYIGDNAEQGIYYNGWSNGVRGSWKRLADVPVTLYNNSSGTTGTVTLSETSANFSYLEIFFSQNTNAGYASTKVYSPNGKRANLSMNNGEANNNISMYTATISISGTSITFNFGRGIAIGSGFTLGGFANDNEIKIYRVIGYK